MKHMFDFLMNEKRRSQKHRGAFPRWLGLLALLLYSALLWGEGSRDFVSYPGYRLFLDNRNPQQLKVYAAEDEYINVGASHLGFAGGFIKVYRPDGTLAATFDGSNGTTGIIFNNIQEQAGPTGGGITNGPGYVPGVVQVEPGEDGIWTVQIAFPTYEAANFPNLLNNAPWTRAAHQPTTPTVICAWDITVTKDNAGNADGEMVEGRVYSNEYVSVISQNGFMTSPVFYILTKGGYLYEVGFMETDPYRFPITSTSMGLVEGDFDPTYASHHRNDVTRSANPANWLPGDVYYYEPQAADYPAGKLINNKIFFNEPDTLMPPTAQVTDIFRNNTHDTWLFIMPSPSEPLLENFDLQASSANGSPCLPGYIEVGQGADIYFESTHSGTAFISLDLNYDGDYDDPVDRTVAGEIIAGPNTVFWDGYDGEGNVVPAADNFTFNYKVELRDGETHIILFDIENNAGGVIMELISDVKANWFDLFFYNHTNVGGPVSGNAANGIPQPTSVPFTYQQNFGENKLLDYWTYVAYSGAAFGAFTINITDDCTQMVIPDSDGDGIRDNVDIDDDNDGVPDLKEYCNPAGGFACLPGGRDPSGDEDGDKVMNFLDANDPLVPNNCIDANNDGICDQVAAVYDTDGDKVPDHLDLDADNDGIPDLVEAGHLQPDADGNGVIDGDPSDFGLNGLFNAIASDPDAPGAVETYTRWDWDADGVPDHDDLDADNDGINDVAEAGYASADSNNDGRIGGGAASPATVNALGLADLIAPSSTGQPIPLPPDQDGDLVPNWHDLDSDNDLIHDVEEGGGIDPDNNAVIGSGLPSVNLNGQAATDPAGHTLTTTSVAMDTDNDQHPDYLDLDTDNDGINDVREAGGNDPDNNGMPGSGAPPVNAKGIPTGANISPTSNPDDTDGDNMSDYRDLDSDNDGINDVAEATRPDPDGDGIIGNGVPVVDMNGRATADASGNALSTTSLPQNTDGNGQPDFRDLDSDDDGIWDATEAGIPDPDHDGIVGNGTPLVNASGQATAGTTSSPTNTDGDNLPDFRDLDSDSDNIPDSDECPVDAPCIDGDSDGAPDFQDFDRDNDGIGDDYECETSTPCTDTDNDGTPDVDDLDTDGDGLADEDECPDGAPCPDSDNDGIPDWREYTCHAGTVVAEIFNATGADAICEGETVLLSASNSITLSGQVTYTWTGPGFNYTGTAAPQGPFLVTVDNISINNAGDFTLQVFTEFGCPSEPETVQVTVTPAPAAPALSISNATPCSGETVMLTTPAVAGGNVQYNWYFENQLLTTTTVPSYEIPNVNPFNSGDYTVQVQNGACESGASPVATLQVSGVQSQTPQLSISADVLCQGQTLGLTAAGITGANVTYEWFFNNGNGPALLGTTAVPSFSVNNVTPSNAGTYTVVASANGCTSSTSNPEVVLIGSQLSQAPVLTVVDDTPCLGGSLQLTTTAYPGMNVTYLWMSNGPNGPQSYGSTSVPSLTIGNVSAANNGSYVVIASTTGCPPMTSAIETVTVNNDIPDAPVLDASGDVFCETETLTLSAVSNTAGNVQYEWFFDNGNGPVSLAVTASPSLDLTNLDVSASGTYAVSVIAGGCPSAFSNSESVTVTNILNQTPSLTASSASLCEGGNLQLTASTIPGATYEWFFDNGSGPVSLGTSPSNNFTINNVTTGNTGAYTVQAAISGCISQPSDVQQVQVNADLGIAPALTVSAGLICEGETLVLNSSTIPGTNVQYEWFFDNGNGLVSLGVTTLPTFVVNNLAPSDAGLYAVMALVGDCTSQLSNGQAVTVSNDLSPAPSLAVVADVICEGEMLELNSSIFPGTNVSYQWYFNNGSGPVLLAETDIPTYFIQNMTAANEGVYTVVVASGNCTTQPSNAQDVTVTNELGNAPALTVSAGQVCEGETLELNSSIYPGTSVSYQWYFDDGTGPVLLATTNVPTYFIQNMTADNAGEYAVVAVMGNCSSQPSNLQDVTVTDMTGPALALAVSGNSVCEGQTLELNSSIYPGTGVQYEWFYDDGSGPVLLATTVVPTFFIQQISGENAGTYSVVAMVGGCETPSSNLQAVNVTTAPAMATENPTDVENPACRGDLVQLNVTPVAGATYQWNGPQGFSASVPNPILPDVQTGQAGVYTATVTVGGCSFTAEPTTVHVFSEIKAEDDEFNVNFNETLVNAPLWANDLAGNVQQWETRIVIAPKNGTATVEDGLLTYTPQQNYFGKDELVYETCNPECPGECDVAMVRLNVLGTDGSQTCFVPNIITPNDDGKNDFFRVPCLENAYANNNVRIFNRWGDKVFETDRYQNDWDGRYKGNPLPPGTYFYLIQLEKGNSDDCLQGYFTITR